MSAPFPIPPLNLSIAPTAQSGARSDGYQAGVGVTSPFGDFNVVGGGQDESRPSLTPPLSTKAIVLGDSEEPQKDNRALIIGGLVLAGIAVWYLSRKKK